MNAVGTNANIGSGRSMPRPGARAGGRADAHEATHRLEKRVSRRLPRHAEEQIEVVIEAQPDQIAFWEEQMQHLITVKAIHECGPATHMGVRLLIDVVSGMTIPTRAEIQRLATQNNLLLRHCGPVGE